MALGDQADSIRAVEPARQHPGKMWVANGELMRPLLAQPTDRGADLLEPDEGSASHLGAELEPRDRLDAGGALRAARDRGKADRALPHRGRRGVLHRLPRGSRARRSAARRQAPLCRRSRRLRDGRRARRRVRRAAGVEAPEPGPGRPAARADHADAALGRDAAPPPSGRAPRVPRRPVPAPADRRGRQATADRRRAGVGDPAGSQARGTLSKRLPAGQARRAARRAGLPLPAPSGAPAGDLRLAGRAAARSRGRAGSSTATSPRTSTPGSTTSPARAASGGSSASSRPWPR